MRPRMWRGMGMWQCLFEPRKGEGGCQRLEPRRRGVLRAFGARTHTKRVEEALQAISAEGMKERG